MSATEAEEYFGRLRGPLLHYFGTTDPDLLAELWQEQARASDERSASDAAVIVVRKMTPEAERIVWDVLDEAALQDAGEWRGNTPDEVRRAAVAFRDVMRSKSGGAT